MKKKLDFHSDESVELQESVDSGFSTEVHTMSPIFKSEVLAVLDTDISELDSETDDTYLPQVSAPPTEEFMQIARSKFITVPDSDKIDNAAYQRASRKRASRPMKQPIFARIISPKSL